ncbi:MAG TPA: hypothetical protein VIH48_02785 [Candidatus Bathyarchaeia archaeon]
MSANQTPNSNVNPNTNVNVGVNPPASAGNGSRIEEVEKEVQKLKADVEGAIGLKSTVDDLKNTIVDIRALISEAQSPFNLLQFITNEEDLNKVIQARPIIERNMAEKASGKTAEARGPAQAMMGNSVAETAKAASPRGFAMETVNEGKGNVQVETAPIAANEKNGNSTPPCIENTVEEQHDERANHAFNSFEEVGFADASKDTSIIHWIYMMLDLGFDEKSIRKICDYCEFSGFMPKGYGIQVSNLVGAVVKARSQNLSAEELILSLYGAATAAGVKTNTEDLKRLIVNVLKKSKTGET